MAPSYCSIRAILTLFHFFRETAVMHQRPDIVYLRQDPPTDPEHQESLPSKNTLIFLNS